MENYQDDPVTLTCRRELYSSTFYELSPSEECRWRHEGCYFYLPGMDGNHITGRMLLAKIKSKEFDTLNNDDAVGVCLLAILELVLLGHEPRHNVSDWCLRNANVKLLEALYATPIAPDSALPKYSLMGFTWAFKGARPNRRLTPDAFEAQAEWWVSSRAFFEGHYREPPRISSPVNQHSRDDVPEDIYRLHNMVHHTIVMLAESSWNKTRNANVSAFDLGKAVVDDNAQEDEVMITGARATEDYVSFENVDPNKVARDPYVECMTFLFNPQPIFLDCHIKGYRAMESFWRELVPQMDKGGYYKVDDPNKVSWLSDDVYMPINARGRFTRRRPQINRLKSLPDHPLIDYGRYALKRMTGADMRNVASLKMARDELLRSMKEKQIIKNYKEM
ncbi:hypothetical protein Tco_1516894 [Tanacetum coccineum]